MDYQVLFNSAILVAGFFGGWILNSIYKSVERLDRDVRDLPRNYVSKADFKDALDRIEGMLIRIADKLDDKADK